MFWNLWMPDFKLSVLNRLINLFVLKIWLKGFKQQIQILKCMFSSKKWVNLRTHDSVEKKKSQNLVVSEIYVFKRWMCTKNINILDFIVTEIFFHWLLNADFLNLIWNFCNDCFDFSEIQLPLRVVFPPIPPECSLRGVFFLCLMHF